MSAPSRRDVLKLGAIGAAGLLSLDLLAACGASGGTKSALDPKTLQPFRPGRGKGTRTGLSERVGWASTADSEFFLALGAGLHWGAAIMRL